MGGVELQGGEEQFKVKNLIMSCCLACNFTVADVLYNKGNCMHKRKISKTGSSETLMQGMEL